MLFGRFSTPAATAAIVAILPKSGCCLDLFSCSVHSSTWSQSYLNLDVVWTATNHAFGQPILSQSYLNLDVVWTSMSTNKSAVTPSQSYLNLDVVWTVILVAIFVLAFVAILPKSGCCLDTWKPPFSPPHASQSYLNLDVVWTLAAGNGKNQFKSQSYLNLDVVWTRHRSSIGHGCEVAILPKSGCCLDGAMIVVLTLLWSQSYLNLDVVWTRKIRPRKSRQGSQSYLNLDVVWTLHFTTCW